ncbi:MAG: hypothetical protein QGH40_02875, partial [bacterium]|nr:hypothetical protein [bacterium]
RIYNDCSYFTWVELDRLVNEMGKIIPDDQNRLLRAKLQRYEYEKEGLEVRTEPLQLKDKHFDNISNEFLDYMYTPKRERHLTALGQTWYDEGGHSKEAPNIERLYEYALAHRAVATKLRWAWRKGYYVKGLTDLARDKELMAKRRDMEE